MNFPLYIAKRYLRSRSKSNAINIITRLASAGIIFGSAALFVVLSVFSGLIDFSLSFSNTIDPDLKALPLKGKSFYISESHQNKIKNIPGIASFSKIAEERVLFVFNGKEQVTYLKGIDSIFTNVSTIKNTIVTGQWLRPQTSQVVLGLGISQKLSLGLFDYNNSFEVYVPKPGKGDIQTPDDAFNKAVLVPIGIYAISEELDSKYVFSDLTLAQDLLGFDKNQVSGIEFKMKPKANETEIINQLEEIFENSITVKNRAQLNDALYKMLNAENIVVYLIFTLIIIVFLFNLVGALIMMIIEKKANLKTLYNLGVEVKALRRIFLLQGTLITVIGGSIGLALGSIIVVLQQYFGLVKITETLAYPVVFTIQNVLIVLTTIIVFGFIASLIASSRVNKKLLENI